MRKFKNRGSAFSQKDEFVKNPCEDFSPEKEEPEQTDELNRELGSVLINRRGKLIYCLTVIGQIEGHCLLPGSNKTTKYEHVIPVLVSVSQDERIDGILIMINTVGGDVEAGLAIAEVIAGIKKPTVSIVLGGGHSIGIPLAVAAKKSFIAKTATMTVHAVRTTGLTVGVPQTFEYFKRIQDRITEFIVENSAVGFTRYTELVNNTSQLAMDVGTILDGEEAVDEGIIDSTGTITDAIDALCDMIGG